MPQIASDASMPSTYGSTAGAFTNTGASSASSLLGSGSLLSGSQASAIGGAVGDFSNALGDFMSISSDNEAASAYAQAASLAGENIDITRTATSVQLLQSQRQLALTTGQQSAAIGANGFSEGTGSGLDIYKASVQQGALAQGLITAQGQVTENAYTAQEQSDLSMEAQAKAKASGALMGGIGSTIAGIASVAALA